MTIANPEHRAKYRQRRFAFVSLFAAAALLLLIIASGWLLGFQVNTTPSEPLGLWRIVELPPSAVRVGMTVFICPPNNGAMREARQRGYLRAGLCSGGFGPLIKTVAAVSGQAVKVTDHLDIDGVAIVQSRIVTTDGKGRALARFAGGIVPPGAVYLHSNFEGSWDSRYFGPVPAAGILGQAQEVLTYAP